MRYVNVLGLAVGLIALGSGALVLSDYWIYLVSTVAITAIIMRGIGITTGQAGMITLCQMSFAALGGWVASWISQQWPSLPFPIVVFIILISTGILGVPIGVLTSRVRGVEFAVITLGVGAIVDMSLRNDVIGSTSSGAVVHPAAPFDQIHWFFGLCWVLLILCYAGVRWVANRPIGLAWAAVSHSERAAAALGINPTIAKTTAFSLGAAFAGMGGSLLGGLYGSLSVESFSPLVSVTYLVTAVLCGASLGSGALLAGIVTVFIPEVLQRVGLPVDLSTALLALGAFDVLRRGRGGIAQQLRDYLDRRNHTGPPAAWNPQLPHASSHKPDHRKRGLDIANLRVQFGEEPVLDGVNLTVGPGEVHALVGANGAGKTSFIDAVSGFLPQATGSIMVEGRPLEGLLAHQRATAGVRRTFQHTRAIDELTIGQYLRLARAGGPRTRTDLDFYAVFSLPEPTTRIARLTLSQRRVVEVAAVFAAQPQVALLDEPAAGLSEVEKVALASIIRNAPGLFRCSVLLIEHDPDFIRECGAHVWTLSEGKIVDHTPQPVPSPWDQTHREQEEP